MQPFSYTGVWWLPGSETHVAGTLTFDGSDYPRLKLVGILHELTDVNANSEIRFEVILGVAEGKRITLSKTIQVNFHISAPGIPTSEIAAPIAIVGSHIERDSDLRFTNMSVAYDHLIEWSGLNAIVRTHQFPTEIEVAAQTVTVSAPRYPEVEVAGASLKFVTSWGTEGEAPYQAGVSQELYIRLAPPAPLTLEEYLTRYFYHIQNFLTLGVGVPLGVRRVSAAIIVGDATEQVELYFNTRAGKEKVVHRWDMLFTRPELGDDWHIALGRWIERADILGPIYDLFFSTIYGANMYLQHEFLSLTQALESYHRRTSAGTYLMPSIFGDLIAALESVIDADSRFSSDIKRTFKDRLKYFNEYSQRKRFRNILRTLGDLASLLVPDPNAFVDSVVTTRNYLTHYDPEGRDSAANNQDLWRLSEQLRFILEVCLLLELAIERPIITSLINKHQRYLRLQSELRRATG
jgi:hypothetical protein